MEDDLGTELANTQADYDWYKENNMCPDCDSKYDKNDECKCEDEEEY